MWASGGTSRSEQSQGLESGGCMAMNAGWLETPVLLAGRKMHALVWCNRADRMMQALMGQGVPDLARSTGLHPGTSPRLDCLPTC